MAASCVQEQLESIYRRGHTVHVYPGEDEQSISKGDLILFGGFGFDGRCKHGEASLHKRSGDVMVFSKKSPGWRLLVHQNEAPAPREFHGSCMLQIGQIWHLFVLGGRSSPKRALADAYLFNFVTLEWIHVPLPSVVSARWRHSCTALVESKVFICGGLSSVSEGAEGAAAQQQFCNDAWVVDLKFGDDGLLKTDCAQVCAPPEGDNNSNILSRHSHSVDFFNGKLYLYGGILPGNMEHNPRDPALYVISPSDDWRITDVVVPEGGPRARYSHSSVVLDNKIIYIGGITQDAAFNQLVSFDPETRQFEAIRVHDCQICGGAKYSSPLFLKHKAVLVEDGQSIVIVGGGALCFSFGTRFSPSCSLRVIGGKWNCCYHKLSDERKRQLSDQEGEEDDDQKEQRPVIRDSSLAKVGSVKKTVTEGKPISQDEVRRLEEDQRKLVCQVCCHLFESRNQLFKHIKLLGHRFNR
eukprot:TRINITY_DN20586_c0_g2_i1.p1 TRINITY_DN20586_c0_g2~~TRINITY_DN20586_c0_g2_i1.p1  ORF type:complete len:468 (+),score=87.61 TRINITY_DN20586_c0_g2_i1:221-1624(+)